MLLFGAEKWVFLAALSKNMERVNMGLLRQVMENTAKGQRDETRRNAAEASVLKEAGT